VREHSELLEVIRRHDRERAVTMIELHIRSAYDRVSKFNFKN
jgi:DNA-binding GntR family transcriptional regulator